MESYFKGKRFEHNRFLNQYMQPEVCVVTRIAKGVVYYKIETRHLDGTVQLSNSYKCNVGDLHQKVGKWL